MLFRSPSLPATTEIYTVEHTLSLHDALPIYVPAAAAIFRFSPLGATELTVAAAAGLAGVAWVELLKLTGRAQ